MLSTYTKLLSLIAVIVLFKGTTFTMAEETPPPDMARYDNYRIYYVEFATEEHVQLFQQLEAQSDSVMCMGHAREPQQKLTVIVAAHKVAEFVDLLHTYNIKYEVLSYNFQEKIDRNLLQVKPKETKGEDYGWQHYYHLETIYEWMNWMVKQHPNDLTLLDMGQSTQGLPIKGLKLAKNPHNKAIFIESGIHAREWIAPATATYIINELLTSKDESIQRLANTYNWIVFPVVNPDGYKYTFEGDRMWRKNRALFGICRGVDLNRNYPNHWNTTGASGDPCRYDFSGPKAASEVETQRLMKFVEDNVEREHIKTYLGRTYRSGSIYETIYPSSGGSKDWAHAEMHIPITFTFELRGPPDSKDLFILNAEEITPTAEEAFVAIVTIVEEAEKKGYYK